MRVILLLLLTLPAWAAMPAAFKFELQHARTALVVQWDGRLLSVQDRDLKTSIVLKKCNEQLLKEFFSVDAAMWRDRPAAGPDGVKIKRGAERFSASTKSRLGAYLVTLRDQLQVLMAEESLACKIK